MDGLLLRSSSSALIASLAKSICGEVSTLYKPATTEAICFSLKPNNVEYRAISFKSRFPTLNSGIPKVSDKYLVNKSSLKLIRIRPSSWPTKESLKFFLKAASS